MGEDRIADQIRAVLHPDPPRPQVAAVFSTVLVIVAPVVGIIPGVRSRRASGWGTAGLATGITGIVLAVLMPSFLLMLAFMAG